MVRDLIRGRQAIFNTTTARDETQATALGERLGITRLELSRAAPISIQAPTNAAFRFLERASLSRATAIGCRHASCTATGSTSNAEGLGDSSSCSGRKYPAGPYDVSPIVVVPSPALGAFAGTTSDGSFKLDLGLSLGHDSPCSNCYSSAGPSEAPPTVAVPSSVLRELAGTAGDGSLELAPGASSAMPLASGVRGDTDGVSGDSSYAKRTPSTRFYVCCQVIPVVGFRRHFKKILPWLAHTRTSSLR
ncbi:hypothetical protein PC123_g25481 [Phytophthora cactorum]|nr:hypothetical protein PC120_g24880 [Phytophthora cactorum]KAG4038959.1 hypothetical protein PC123_g25481 [Phytophthora cactorum]